MFCHESLKVKLCVENRWLQTFVWRFNAGFKANKGDTSIQLTSNLTFHRQNWLLKGGWRLFLKKVSFRLAANSWGFLLISCVLGRQHKTDLSGKHFGAKFKVCPLRYKDTTSLGRCSKDPDQRSTGSPNFCLVNLETIGRFLTTRSLELIPWAEANAAREDQVCRQSQSCGGTM